MERMALFRVCLFLLIIYHAKCKSLPSEEVCTSPECIDTANLFLRVMNKKGDPCNDFYDYACGNFGNEFPLSDGEFHRSLWGDAGNRVNRMTTQVLTKPSLTNSESLAKTKAFYQSCMNKELKQELKLQPLYDLLAKVGLPKFPTTDAAAEFNLGKTIGLTLRYLGMAIFVDLEIDKSEISPDGKGNFTLEVSPVAGGPLMKVILNPEFESLLEIVSAKQIISVPTIKNIIEEKTPEMVFNHTLTFLESASKLILDDLALIQESAPSNETEISHDVSEMLTFAVEFYKMLNNSDNSEEVGDAMTFAELESLLNDTDPSPIPGNKIVWKDYFNGVFSDDQANLTYELNYDISVQTAESFQNLSTFLSAQKTIDIMRFVWWSVVFEFAKYTTEEMFSLYYYLPGSINVTPETFCLTYVQKHFSYVVANEIKTVYGLANRTEKVEEMLNTIKSEFESLVHAIDWLDIFTKDYIVDLSSSISSEIGYDERILDSDILDGYYKNFEPKKDEFLMNMARMQEWQMLRKFELMTQSSENISELFDAAFDPLDVNAFYKREENMISMPAGILQKPFFFRGLEALNYGALGTILAHELTHAFDSFTNFIELKEVLQGHPMYLASDKQFNDRSKCFINQYSKFNFSKKKKLNGTLTLQENIADNGGLRESYNAYQTYKKKYGSELKLPGFEEFSHEQLLFLSFGTLWCETITSEYQSHLLEDPHSPNRVRVIATLQNMKEFASAFQCPSGSFMNPSNKCMIW